MGAAQLTAADLAVDGRVGVEEVEEIGQILEINIRVGWVSVYVLILHLDLHTKSLLARPRSN